MIFIYFLLKEDGNGSDEDEDALDMDDFIEKGGLEEDDNVVEVMWHIQGGRGHWFGTQSMKLTFFRYSLAQTVCLLL